MATTITMRPWTAIVRSITTKAPFRAQAPVISQRCPRRWASDSTSPPPLNNESTSQSPSTIPEAPDAAPPSLSAEEADARTPTYPFLPSSPSPPLTPKKKKLPSPSTIRPPRAVQATYLRPLRRTPTHGLPVCDLQLRSYSVRNLEFFSDFCLRAAYYLGLPASGPVPLPRITERWTVPKGSFIHKKSQENFERKTLRRLIQIKDGERETVEVWLAFVKKYAYYGIGMKANVWAFEKLGVGKTMDEQMEQMRSQVEPTLDLFALKKGSAVEDKVLELINREDFKAASGGNGPMIRTPTYQLPKN